jgi:hypothetical protein
VKTQVNVILGRVVAANAGDLESEISDLKSEIAVRHVTRATDEAFAAMDRLYGAHGFPANWAAGLLQAGDRAVVVLDPESDSAPAAAWITRRPFYVREIRRTFDPGPDGDYYFGDFVSPAARGRGLQRLVIAQRLELSRGRTALAMTCPENDPSQSNYQSLGFTPIATLISRFIAGTQIDRCCPAFPKYLSGEGLPLPGQRRLRFR